ncbi:MAG: class I SAM-dependent methyltransferase [Anaerolineae bacterium]|nr:class I SAM-dependent methyltransferase [Anaerolineae bacterium]
MESIQELVDFWEKLADVYDKDALTAGVAYPAIIDKVEKALNPSDRLLDVGSGTGTMGAHVAPLVRHLTCSDVSAEMLGKAQDRLVDFDNIDYRIEDAKSLGFDDCTFDAVLCCNMLHQMPDPELALGEMLRVLRPGGRLLAITVTSGGISLGGNGHTDIQFLLRFGRPPAMRSFRLSTFYNMVASSGFRVSETLWENRDPLPAAFILAVKPDLSK